MSEEKLDILIDMQKETREETREFMRETNKRLRVMEDTQAQQKGAFKLLTYLGLPGTAGIAAMLSKFFH
jgi:hypothetical protein